ncbi:hypothetical protein BASA81_015188 [Batrachochytrium salamandrivorans]|nr:hypothetical protein BASA81_015188 [Batrachochytrium salamandrivorans]
MAAEAFAEAEDEEEEEEEVIDLPEWQVFNLHPLLLKAIAKLGFTKPSPIQRVCIPTILDKGKDVLGVSETGSGKTLAYGLPILSRLITDLVQGSSRSSEEGVQCLVVAPTRELAMQVTEHFRAVLQCVPLEFRPRVETVVGGISEDKQERLLNNLPAIVVATMGRLKSFLVDRPHSHLGNMKQSLKFLVLDEADRLSDPMHAHDLQPLLDMLIDVNKSQNKQRQTLLFSATLLNIEDHDKNKGSTKKVTSGPLVLMDKLGRRGKPEVCEVIKGEPISSEAANAAVAAAVGNSGGVKAKAIALAVEKAKQFSLPDTISLSLVECTDEDKEQFLHYVVAASLASCRSILVFVNTITATHRLSCTLALAFPDMVIGSLHANMDQTQRLRNLDRFKKQTEQKRLLVCSDVAARGLDVPAVDLVIHYGIPSRVDTFVHRSGRCGRAGRKGTVVSLSSGLEVARMGKIRNAINPRKMDPFVSKDATVTSKAVFARHAVCKKLYALQSSEKGKNFNENWRKRTAEEAELELSDDDDIAGINAEEKQDRTVRLHSEIAKLQNELSRMIAGVSTKQPGQYRKGRKRVNL